MKIQWKVVCSMYYKQKNVLVGFWINELDATLQPVFIPDSLDTAKFSQPLVSHPDAEGFKVSAM